MMEARAALQRFETVLVLSGDVPLITAETIKRVRDFHNAHHAAMTMLTAEPPDPTGYGRVFRKKIKGKESDEVERIVEQKSLRGTEAAAARRSTPASTPSPPSRFMPTSASSRPTMPTTSTT